MKIIQYFPRREYIFIIKINYQKELRDLNHNLYVFNTIFLYEKCIFFYINRAQLLIAMFIDLPTLNLFQNFRVKHERKYL